MDEDEQLAQRFEANRARLRAVAHRMLGSFSAADDAVQEAWLRLSRSDATAVDNLDGWLTTVVGRICLDELRSRRSRREQPLDAQFVAAPAHKSDPEDDALLADSVGLALMVVLETLAPAERLAFVLHDLFGVPFDDIAPIVGRSPAAAKMLASRARHRVQGATPTLGADRSRQRIVVDAFIAASRSGSFEALIAVLDPEVVLRVDFGAAGVSRVIRGARAVADQALTFSRFAQFARAALVETRLGIVTVIEGQPISAMALTIRDMHIIEIDLLADPVGLAQLEVTLLND